jgi:ABC-type Fe3+-siderophore transport system permease subunit
MRQFATSLITFVIGNLAFIGLMMAYALTP